MSSRPRRIACIVGQSNEEGAGVLRDRSVLYGCPTVDPVGPRGYNRTMWPRLAELMGMRGIWLSVYNTAVGGTSLAHSWCGYIRTWTSSMLVLKGSYVLSGGKTWLCMLASNTVNASTVVPAAGLQADGVTWSDLGASVSTDVPGICNTQHPRFDPNGYIANAYAGPANAVGYDEKWCFISIGQGDKSLSVVASDYTKAIQNVTDYMLARGVKVAVGMTCYGNTAGLVAWYDAELLPGRAAALAFYARDKRVIAGANLATALGILPTDPPYGTPGVQADLVHMNDAAYWNASGEWASSLVASGQW